MSVFPKTDIQKTIPGINILLDPTYLLGEGEVLPADGASISSWKDTLQNQLNADNGTGAEQPLFKTEISGLNPMVLFDGIDDVLEIPSSSVIDDLYDGGGSFLFVIYPTSDGGNSQGRLFSQGGGNSYIYLSDEAGGVCRISLYKNFSTTQGEWETTSLDVNIGQPNIIFISYDQDSVSNDPLIYVNSKTSSSLTEVSTPIGAATASAVLRIGNSATTSRSFDGYIGDVLFSKGRILSEGDRNNLIDSASNKYGIELI